MLSSPIDLTQTLVTIVIALLGYSLRQLKVDVSKSIANLEEHKREQGLVIATERVSIHAYIDSSHGELLKLNADLKSEMRREMDDSIKSTKDLLIEKINNLCEKQDSQFGFLKESLNIIRQEGQDRTRKYIELDNKLGSILDKMDRKYPNNPLQ